MEVIVFYAALGFLFTFWAKPKSKIRPIGQNNIAQKNISIDVISK
jgi:hypothetical protein